MNHVCHFSLHLIKTIWANKIHEWTENTTFRVHSNLNRMVSIVSMRKSVVISLVQTNIQIMQDDYTSSFVPFISYTGYVVALSFGLIFNAWELVGQVDELGVFIICSKHPTHCRTCQSRASEYIYVYGLRSKSPGAAKANWNQKQDERIHNYIYILKRYEFQWINTSGSLLSSIS